TALIAQHTLNISRRTVLFKVITIFFSFFPSFFPVFRDGMPRREKISPPLERNALCCYIMGNTGKT
ncbi:MAG: hypothetical protein J6331_05140, partial [Lentisphaeria bacterium]|nr:hypothetical protein [Lentisphaeria bacterium]